MADAFKGLTIRIGADTRPLSSAMNSVKYSIGQVQTHANALAKALRFDSSSSAVLSSSLRASQERLQMTARSAQLLRTSLMQSANETVTIRRDGALIATTLKGAAGQIGNVFSETQRVRSMFNGIDKSLEEIYDGVIRWKAATEGISLKEAKADVLALKNAMNGVGTDADGAKAAMREMESHIIRMASEMDELPFGLKKGYASAQELVSMLHSLRSSQRQYNEELSDLNRIQSFEAARLEAAAYGAEVRKAASETVALKARLYEVGEGGRIARAANEVRLLSAASEGAMADVREMSAAFDAMPRSMEAARAKFEAIQSAEAALAAKLSALQEKMRSIARDSGFDAAALDAKSVRVQLAQATAEAEKWQARLSNCEAALESMREDAEKLKAEGKESGSAFLALQNRIEKAESAIDRVRTSAAAADAQLNKATKAQSLVSARQEAVKTKAELESLNAVAKTSLSSAFGSLRTLGYSLYSTITPAIMIAGSYAVNAAKDIDSAWRDMRKTVNGSEEDFVRLKDAAIEFSRTHVTSADTMLEIEAMGGQLGIAVGNLEAFSEVVSNLDIATDIDAEDMAKQIGQLSNIMRDIDQSNPAQYQKDITSFSDALVRLGNNSAAQESSIMQVMMRIASLGTISGFTTPQLLAISTAAAATGQGCEAAGTAIAKTFSNIEGAVGAGGDTLDAFAEVAQMSADEFAEAWSSDPMAAFDAFIRGLKAIDEAGGSVDQTLVGLKITSVRQKQALENLVSTYDVLTDSIGMATTAWNGESYMLRDGSIEYAGDAAREAAAKSEGFAAQLEIISNNAKALAMELASGAEPVIKEVSGAIQQATKIVSSMPDKLKTSFIKMAAAAAAAGPVLIFIGSIASAFVNLKQVADLASQTKGFAFLTESVKKAKEGSTLLSAALSRLGTIGLPAAAAGALVAVAAIAALVDAVKQAQQRQENYRKSTEDLAKLLGTPIEDMASEALRNQADAADWAKYRLDEYREIAEKAASEGAELYDKWSDSLSDAANDSALIQVYADKIEELAGKCEGSAVNMALLRNAVSKYNELTGDNIRIIDNETGAIDANTEALQKNAQAAKDNAYAKAYTEIYNDAVKRQAELGLEIEAQTRHAGDLMDELADKQRIMDDELAKSPKLFTKEYQEASAEANQLKMELGAMEEPLDQLKEQYDAAGDAVSTAEREMARWTEAADGNAEAAKRLEVSFGDYLAALGGVSEGQEAWNALMAATSLGTDDLAQSLSGAGISAAELAAIGTENFAALYAAASQDIGGIRLALDLLAAADIPVKDITVTDNGTIETAEQGIWQLDLAAGTISQGDNVITVESTQVQQATTDAEQLGETMDEETGEQYSTDVDDSDITDATDDAEELGSALSSVTSQDYSTTVTADTSPAMNAIASLRRELDSLTSSTYSVSIAVSASENAAGAVSRVAVAANAAGALVPRNAAGALNGIVTSARLTNIGWVGEAGAEAVMHMRHAGGAVVPLSNRRYVRPFASAVASEMPRYEAYDDSMLVAEVRSLHQDIANLKLYMDAKEVGGVLAPEMNRRLGRMEAANAR